MSNEHILDIAKSADEELANPNIIHASDNIDYYQSQNELSVSQGSFYRSKAFTASLGINPLVAAASAVLSLIHPISRLTECEDLTKLQQDLIYEIKAFEHQAQTHNYPLNTLLIARYILALSLDETISQLSWGKEAWEEYRLVQHLDLGQIDDNRLIEMVERMVQEPALYIDILELMYLCISVGPHANDMAHHEKKIDYNTMLENIYHCIKRQRGSTPKSLSLLSKHYEKPEPASKIIPLWLCVTFGSILLLSIILGFNFLMNVNEKPLQQQLLSIHQQLQNVELADETI